MESLLSQFCSVTGATEEVGRHLLDACGGSLEMAVGMHLDSGGAVNTPPPEQDEENSATTSAGPQSQPQPDEESDVRAPIPQTTEVLVEEQFQFGFRGRRKASRSVFDGFRDFRAETRQQEQRLLEGAGEASSSQKQRTLEDLFRPPIDLLHKGTFLSAKQAGVTDNRWLLVNIQNVQEFPCQVLNRDVWSHHKVRRLIKEHFLFWQVYSDSEEGKRFIQYYKVHEWPFVAVIDPQTGENLVTWNNVKAESFCELANQFIEEQPNPVVTSPPNKRRKREDSIVDASEESQLEAAIVASMQPRDEAAITLSSDSESLESDTDSDCDLETFTDSEAASGEESVPKTSLAAPPRKVTDCRLLKGSKNRGDAKASPSRKGKAPTNATSSTSCRRLGNGNAVVDETSSSSSRASVSASTSASASRSSDDVMDRVADLNGGRKGHGDVTNDVIKDGSCSAEKASDGVSETWSNYLGSDSDEKTKLMVRFPDGQKVPLSMACTSKLKALMLYASNEKKYDPEKYELVTNFPRRKLSTLDPEITLLDLGLHPQETVFVQEKS